MLKLDGQKLDDGRWFTGSVERNKDPILNLLKRVLPHTGLVLEIGSGTGQHVAHFAKALPELTWQPSDPDNEFRDSIRLWTKLESLDNVRAPIDLEVCRFPWPVTRADAVLCVNMIHEIGRASCRERVESSEGGASSEATVCDECRT